MFINTGFMFDDIDSSYYDMIIVRPDGEKIDAPFGARRTIIEEKVPLKPIPYFYGVDEEPLSFTITITKSTDGTWDRQTRERIVQWLFQKNYKPFVSYDNEDIAYYVVAVGDPRRFDTSLQQGWATIEFRANAPWGYNYPKAVLDYPQVNYGDSALKLITLQNKSNICQYHYPELEFELLSSTTSISIKNFTVGGNELTFTGLQSGEKVYVNNASKSIISSLESSGIYRYSNCNKKWLSLVQGVNTILVTGKCNFQVRLQYPIAL